MAADLLERNAELDDLGGVLRGAAQGRGATVLISGEAGIGKTTLVRTFADGAMATARVLVGACDDLLTPRALGPFRDMAMETESLRTAFASGGDRETVLMTILDVLSEAPGPNVMIVEDLHWADDATLDAVRFLARRVEGVPAVLVLTYRDDEPDHQLQRVLGALTGDRVHRFKLEPLSLEAVTLLNSAGRLASDDLFGATGGNPFYVTEVLASAEAEVPATVRDAVLARLRLLGHRARSALDLLSVIPARVERPLADVLLEGEPAVLDEAERRGVIVASPTHLWFRHELARRAIEQSLGTSTRISFNRRVLDALLDTGVEASRIVHHAVQAHADEVVAEFAPTAASDAARAGAHREALEHYARALSLRDGLLTPRDRAAVLQGSASSLYLLQRYGDGAEHGRAAIALWEEIGDTIRLGETLVTYGYNVYWTGDPESARAAAHRAVELLEPQGPTGVLALAYGVSAGIRLMADDPEGVAWGLKAQAVAEKLGRDELVASALNYVGSIKMSMGDPEGETLLERALDITQRLPPHSGAWIACRICANYASKLLRFARVDQAERYVERGLAISREFDLQHGTSRLEAHSATINLFRGHWDEAEATLRDLIRLPRDEGLNDAYVLASLGRLLARRGDPDAQDHLRRAWAIAGRSGEAARVAGLAVDWLEWAWLTEQGLPATVDLKAALELAERRNHNEFRGAILRYLARMGELVEPFEECPERFALGISGRWKEAAEQWEQLGNPYESALELLDSHEVDPTLDALSALDELGAEPAAALARRRLRELGVRRIPRGPQPTTKENPAGLTSRQVDVLALLAGGLTNAEIAEKLVVSTRTVDHHVSAILAKLGTSTRREAAAAALELGISALETMRPQSTAARSEPQAH
jgi:DNA-binding CsgD family transcriptional regulator